MTPTTIRVRRLIGELGYAQRRMFELNTGVSLTDPRERSRRSRRQISELDSAWELGFDPTLSGR